MNAPSAYLRTSKHVFAHEMSNDRQFDLLDNEIRDRVLQLSAILLQIQIQAHRNPDITLNLQPNILWGISRRPIIRLFRQNVTFYLFAYSTISQDISFHKKAN